VKADVSKGFQCHLQVAHETLDDGGRPASMSEDPHLLGGGGRAACPKSPSLDFEGVSRAFLGAGRRPCRSTAGSHWISSPEALRGPFVPGFCRFDEPEFLSGPRGWWAIDITRLTCPCVGPIRNDFPRYWSGFPTVLTRTNGSATTGCK